MVRVGVDENLAPELLVDFPPQAEIVRLPRTISSPVEVDFWICRSIARMPGGIPASSAG